MAMYDFGKGDSLFIILLFALLVLAPWLIGVGAILEWLF